MDVSKKIRFARPLYLQCLPKRQRDKEFRNDEHSLQVLALLIDFLHFTSKSTSEKSALIPQHLCYLFNLNYLLGMVTLYSRPPLIHNLDTDQLL